MSNHLQRFLSRLFMKSKNASFDESADEKRMRTQSTGQLRDLKKRRNLRQKRTDKRRVSAPPEMNSRFLITRRQGIYELSPDLPIGSKFISPPKSPVRHPNNDKERLLFVSPLIGFAERPVDCEVKHAAPSQISHPVPVPQPLSTETRNEPLILKLGGSPPRPRIENENHSSNLRRAGTPHVKKKRARRPASCGDLLEPKELTAFNPPVSPIAAHESQYSPPYYMNLPLYKHQQSIPISGESPAINQTMPGLDESVMNVGSLGDRPNRRPSKSVDSADQNNLQSMFRQDFVKGLWSMGQYRLHVNDAGTNTENYYEYIKPSRDMDDTGISNADHSINTQNKSHDMFNCLFEHSISKTPPYAHISPLSTGSTASTDSGRDTDKQAGTPSSGKSFSPSGLGNPVRERVETGVPYSPVQSLLRKKHGKPIPAPRRRSRSQPLLDQDDDMTSVKENMSSPGCKHMSSSQMSLASVELTNDWKATVAIDIGTAYSGYSAVYHKERGKVVRLPNEERIPCSLLLGQDGNFHSFGTQAAEFYHNLESTTSAQYAYFDNFKSNFHSEPFAENSQVIAKNGSKWPAAAVFAHSFRYFKRKFLDEHGKSGQPDLDPNKIRWIITVPSTWTFSSRILLRHTAFQAGLVPSLNPEQVQVISECDAVATYCCNNSKIGIANDENLKNGGSFVTVLCGAENVEITVFRSHYKEGKYFLKEMHRTSAGAYGSHGIDIAFKGLLIQMFGNTFITEFISKYPASWHCIIKHFESVKRLAHPFHLSPFPLVLPSAFVDFHKKCRGFSVEKAVKKFGSQYIKWTQQEMLCFYPEAIQQLFAPTVYSIIECVSSLVKQYTTEDSKHKCSKIYLLGGFAHSPMLAHAMRIQFADLVKIEVPLNPSGCISEGAIVAYTHRSCIRIPRARYTYGVSVLHPFDANVHPEDKRIERQGSSWCTDVFDRLICVGQSLSHPKHRVTRSYCPAKGENDQLVVQVYCSDVVESPKFVTEAAVKRIAVIKLNLPNEYQPGQEFQLRFDFHGVAGGALTVSAIDTSSKMTIPCELQPISA